MLSILKVEVGLTLDGGIKSIILRASGLNLEAAVLRESMEAPYTLS